MVRNHSGDGKKRMRRLVRAAATEQRPTRRCRRSPGLLLSLVLVLATGILGAAIPSAAQAATLPAGFAESIVFSGLTNPTAVRFAKDGRVFVAEKRGVIKVFTSLTDTTPDVFADLNANVYNFWDRGLLGMTLAPNFPTDPYVYVLYTYDHELGSTAAAPRWGTQGVYSDPCPTPPGATGDGCLASGRLSRLQAAGNFMTGNEQVLVEDWCQQYPSHSIGTVDFGEDGKLYASGGDGASFNFADWGRTARRSTRAETRPVASAPRLARRPLRVARCAARTCAPQLIRSPSMARSSGWIRPRALGFQTTRWPHPPMPMPGASLPTACGTPSASPRDRTPTSYGWETSAGTTGKRSTS